MNSEICERGNERNHFGLTASEQSLVEDTLHRIAANGGESGMKMAERTMVDRWRSCSFLQLGGLTLNGA